MGTGFLSAQPQYPPAQEWQPGIWKRLPRLGLTALLVAVGCAFGGAIVLKSCDGVEIGSWPSKKHPFEPTVILAIFAAANNAAMHFALQEGVKYAWWNKALKGGTLKELHEYWSYGMGLTETARAGRSFNRVAFASILTSVVCIAAPMFQHAITVSTETVTREIELSASLSPDPLPSGFSGMAMADQSANLVSYQFSRVVQDYTSRNDIKLDYRGCDGTCEASVVAAGFDVDCTRTTSAYDFTSSTNSESNTTDQFTAGSITFSFNGEQDSSTIKFNASYKADPSCTGTMTTVSCSLQAATVTYNLTLQNGTAALLPAGPNDTVALHRPPPEQPASASTLGGFYLAARHLFASTITYSRPSNPSTNPWSVLSTGPMASTYLQPPSPSPSTSSAVDACALTWTDPTPSILHALRALALRSAIAIAANANANATPTAAPARQSRAATTYTTHPAFLAVALAVTLLDALAVAPLFARWWALGRAVSLSPVEVARAFGAPALARACGGGGTNADARSLVAAAGVGGVRVRYGEVDVGGEDGGGGGGGFVRREKADAGKGEGPGGRVSVTRAGSGRSEQELVFERMQDVEGIFGAEAGRGRAVLGFGREEGTGRPENGRVYC